MKTRPALLLMSSLIALSGNAFAEDTSPPLPLHGIEGYGGIAITYSAYLTNPAADNKILGLPSFGAGLLSSTESRIMGFGTAVESHPKRPAIQP